MVANEVKELAKQTSEATEDIIRKIAMIQDDTQQAVDAIAQVTGIIRQINESQNAIASAVEEQSSDDRVRSAATSLRWQQAAARSQET